ncbi:MAG: hypothetical protein GYA34_09240 [Chloroflexi bacterium]|nr:hypothetical protein [Chloroflexota bacterium]
MKNSYLYHALQTGLICAAGSEIKLKVNGTSMFPCLKSGDNVYAIPEPINNLMIGDVVAVMREHDIITHRLIKIDGNHIYCKGDNSHIPDPPVKADQIIGKIVAVEREGKRIAYDHRYWIKKNRTLGRLGYLEYRIYHFGSRFIKQQNGYLKNNPHISVGRIVFLPFRAIMRLILFM